MTRYFTFIGATTSQSSIVRIFPLWRDALQLGSDVELRGEDFPLHAPPDSYRRAVERIKSDPCQLGALVTTHKIDLYTATHDIFDKVDMYAALCGELSCIAHRAGSLLGWAKDPISAGRALHCILGDGYFGRTGADVLCFGAGGAGVAISLHLMTRPEVGDRPVRLTVTDRDGRRLDHLREIHARLDSDVVVEYVHTDDRPQGDALIGALSPYSLVVNATGMGKDIPGSPLSDAALFPWNSIAWDLNYRGQLNFVHQARVQQISRNVRVEDGWKYFIFGWTAVMEEVFERPISDRELEALSRTASFARPPLVPPREEG